MRQLACDATGGAAWRFSAWAPEAPQACQAMEGHEAKSGRDVPVSGTTTLDVQLDALKEAFSVIFCWNSVAYFDSLRLRGRKRRPRGAPQRTNLDTPPRQVDTPDAARYNRMLRSTLSLLAFAAACAKFGQSSDMCQKLCC